MEIGSGDDDCSPSQYRKARLMHDSASGVEESDRESENGVESEGSVTSSEGPPSLSSSSADEDDEATYRKRFIEDEEKKAARRKEQIAEDQKQAPPEEFTPPRKKKPDLVAETESDECNIATDSTRTPLRRILHAPWTLVCSFSRDQHSDVEMNSWMEARANAIMDQAGPYAGQKISAEDIGYFKAS